MLKKQLFFTISLLAIVFACQRTLTYTPIAEKYVLDYKIDRLENEIVNYEKLDAAIGLDKLQAQVLFYGS